MSVAAAVNGWQSYKLRDVVTKLVDGSHNPPPKQAQGHPMLSARNIDQGRINFDEFRFISNESFETEDARTRVTPGDVLLTIVGTIGRSAVVPDTAAPFVLQRSVAVISPKDGLLPQFLAYQFQSPQIQRYFEQHARGTAQKGVYLKTLGETPILVPPIAKQEAVVAELDKQFSRLDEAVANLGRVQANLRRYQDATLTTAVQGKLGWRNEGDGDQGADLLSRIRDSREATWMERVGGSRSRRYRLPAVTSADTHLDIPEHWAIASLDELTPGDRECAYGVLQPGDDIADGVPFIRVGDVNDGLVAIDALKRIEPSIAAQYPRTQLEGGELLITIVGTIGRTAVVPTALNGANVARAIGVVPLTKLVNPRWVSLWFESPAVRLRMDSAAHEVARKTLNLEDVRRAPVALPPLGEQDRIVQAADQALSLVSKTRKELDAALLRTRSLRDVILAAAFSIPP